ncbi:cupin domain-containing protein [Helicobacter anatolicus]|uniref:cupin domain-containing protein n=1 Tax=Helicobacter anatolicus TaxID=2905874 RepID=UPI001E5F422D|nr:cupin domain-containing protein [Helicobacter anatolicus]MCE3037047.1 cupin domain-containing protein [Helicobacter anatolicus]MCE3038745.1 cupin domain-containing protein [Helicobacter anatolicus]MCE3040454.1 cupin domain-containing protein [Helicobacter anatolicus]
MQIIHWNHDNFEKFGTKILHENQSAKEIQITMPKDCVMKEHSAPFDISVQVLKGKIWFKIDQEEVVLNALDMVTLDAKIVHSLGAYEDSIVRLSLSKNDTAVRLNNILK